MLQTLTKTTFKVCTVGLWLAKYDLIEYFLTELWLYEYNSNQYNTAT